MSFRERLHVCVHVHRSTEVCKVISSTEAFKASFPCRVFFFFFCPRFSWRLWKKIPLRRKDSMSGLCSSRRTSCPGNISSRVWAAHPLNMTCLQDALSTSVGYERKRIVIKATVEKNVMVYGLNAVWHSSLLALFFFFLHRLY